MPVPWLAIAGAATPFLSQGLNFLSGQHGIRKQYHMNKALAERQFELDVGMMEFMNDYNSPIKQRQRLEDAGFNPLMAISGGNPGNMSSAPQAPRIQPPDIASIYANLGTRLQESRLLGAQADLTQQKFRESGVKQDLMEQQKALIKANPYLNEGYVKSMVTLMESTASMKQQERNFMLSSGREVDTSRGMQKMQMELDILTKKYDLAKADQQIKAEILRSKGFQADLQEIQKKWLADGEITPQHIYMGIMLLLQKLM